MCTHHWKKLQQKVIVKVNFSLDIDVENADSKGKNMIFPSNLDFGRIEKSFFAEFVKRGIPYKSRP